MSVSVLSAPQTLGLIRDLAYETSFRSVSRCGRNPIRTRTPSLWGPRSLGCADSTSPVGVGPSAKVGEGRVDGGLDPVGTSGLEVDGGGLWEVSATRPTPVRSPTLRTRVRTGVGLKWSSVVGVSEPSRVNGSSAGYTHTHSSDRCRVKAESPRKSFDRETGGWGRGRVFCTGHLPPGPSAGPL